MADFADEGERAAPFSLRRNGRPANSAMIPSAFNRVKAQAVGDKKRSD
jgi:hypothetical protein